VDVCVVCVCVCVYSGTELLVLLLYPQAMQQYRQNISNGRCFQSPPGVFMFRPCLSCRTVPVNKSLIHDYNKTTIYIYRV